MLQERVVWDLLPKPVARRYAPDIVEVHRSGRSAEPLPRLEPPLTQSQGQVSNKLREVARAEADSYAMSAELLARKREVEHCIRHFARTGELSPGYSGWREELVGDRFRRILAKLR